MMLQNYYNLHAGLTEYTVDLQKREVTIKGDFMANCNLQDESIRSSSLL